MKAVIVKEIKTEVRELEDRKPYFREAIMPELGAYMTLGEFPTMDITMTEITYERMRLMNPETREETNYFVKLDDRKLFGELIKVSDGFINSKIEKGIQRFKDDWLIHDLPEVERRNWEKGVKDARLRFKALPWYHRLFY